MKEEPMRLAGSIKEDGQMRLAEHVGDTLRGLYRHWKGSLYVVFSESVHEASGDVLLHYYSLEHRTRWTRTLEDFTAIVTLLDASKQARFVRIREALEAELFQAAFDNE